MHSKLDWKDQDFKARTPGCTALYTDLRKLIQTVGHVSLNAQNIVYMLSLSRRPQDSVPSGQQRLK
jgi:hypothetical protein